MGVRCLITGGNGFLGNGLKRYLTGWDNLTIGRVNCDIKYNYVPDEEVAIPEVDVVIYAMGKAHDFSSKKMSTYYGEMFDTNCKKLKLFLDQLSKSKSLPITFIYISSVSVYGIKSGLDIDENHQLGATDPYGKSKIEAEKIVSEWTQKENIKCVILRLPLIIGDDPPGNLNRMIKALKKKSFILFDHGKAKKSVVHIESIADVISKSVGRNGIFNITDCINPTFKEIVYFFTKAVNARNPISIPSHLIKVFLKIGSFFSKRSQAILNTIDKMTLDLTFSNKKAIKEFKWNPKPALGYNVRINI